MYSMKEFTGYRSILITGPKNSGKSVCARALGDITAAGIVDLDELVEKETGKTPRELFREGPDIFKRAESRALAGVLSGIKAASGTKPLIIASGGGLIDNPEAMVILEQNKNIAIVYLEVSPETAWKRITGGNASGELPPFLNTENPKETHFTLHKRRSAAYKTFAQSNGGLSVQAEGKTPAEIAREITDFFMLLIEP